MATFSGFPVQAFEFYDALAADNSKAFWTAHKSEYEAHVKAPLEQLISELGEEFGPGKMFRPYNDVRFSKDKRPYKEHQGAYVPTEDGIGYYVQLGAEGLFVAGGWWSPASMQVGRYRDSVDGPAGVVLEQAIAAAEKSGMTLGGDVMKTKPRGVPDDHPRLELLRHRTLTVEHKASTAAWVGTRKAFTHVQKSWRAMTPLIDWLTDHVGPADDGIPAEPR